MRKYAVSIFFKMAAGRQLGFGSREITQFNLPTSKTPLLIRYKYEVDQMTRC